MQFGSCLFLKSRLKTFYSLRLLLNTDAFCRQRLWSYDLMALSERVNHWRMCNRNAKSEYILIKKICALVFESICERTAKFREEILFDSGVINLQTPTTKYLFLIQHSIIMDARSASVHVIFCRCFFHIFFMGTLVGQTAERIFTKLSHVVDIRCYLRTY